MSVAFEEDGAEFVELLDFGGGEGAIVDADVVDCTVPVATRGVFLPIKLLLGVPNPLSVWMATLWPFTYKTSVEPSYV